MSLFDKFAPLGLRNRAVMAPLTRFACTSDGKPTEQLIQYYIRRAKQRTGLIIVESCAINPTHGLGYLNGAQLFTQEQADVWKELVEGVHKEGAKIWIQLFHPGRLTTNEISKVHPLAPSPIAPGLAQSFWRPKINDQIVNFQTLTTYKTPNEASISEIEQIIDDFQNSTRLAIQAGFDGIEIHGAHGYLIHQFNSALVNQRTDKYGFDGKFSFANEIVRRCKEMIHVPDFSISFRLSVHMIDNPLIRFDIKRDKFDLMIHSLEKSGVDVFHVSAIDSKSPIFGANEQLHSIIRGLSNKPIIICGGVKTLEQANTLLTGTPNSLIAFGRNFISNPDLIELMYNQKEENIVPFSYEEHINKIF